MGIDPPKMRQRHVIELQQYAWPGNIRELQNVIERAVISCRSGPLQFHLPDHDTTTADEPTDVGVASTEELMTDDEMRNIERQNLLAVLERAKWKISGSGGAAEFLGVTDTKIRLRPYVGLIGSRGAQPFTHLLASNDCKSIFVHGLARLRDASGPTERSRTSGGWGSIPPSSTPWTS